MALGRRLPQPALRHRHSLVFPRPRRCGMTQKPQRTVLTGAELEAPTCGDDQGIAGLHINGGDILRVGIGRTTPHLPSTIQHVPDLFHSTVPDRAGDFSGTQSDFNQTAICRAMAYVHQQAYLRAVGSR